jgi:hypothetical protein
MIPGDPRRDPLPPWLHNTTDGIRPNYHMIPATTPPTHTHTGYTTDRFRPNYTKWSPPRPPSTTDYTTGRIKPSYHMIPATTPRPPSLITLQEDLVQTTICSPPRFPPTHSHTDYTTGRFSPIYHMIPATTPAPTVTPT